MTLQQNLDDLDSFLKRLSTVRVHPEQMKADIQHAQDNLNALKDKLRDDGTKRSVPLSQERDQAQPGQHTHRSDEVKLRLVEKVNGEKRDLQKQVQELTDRLSAVMGKKINESNPNIADLSDPHRPTKLVEGFRLLYDNEWTDAYESLHKANTKENDIIDILGGVVKNADNLCTRRLQALTEQIRQHVTDDICTIKETIKKDQEPFTQDIDSKVTLEEADVNFVKGHINDIVKALADVSGKLIANIFSPMLMESVKKSFKKIDPQTDFTHLNSFAGKAVNIIWKMKVQQPPMELLWQNPGNDMQRKCFHSTSTKVKPFVNASGQLFCCIRMAL